jgi:DNA-binding Lrp family transcriptional regulator
MSSERIDTKDEAILRALSEDCRMSLRQIGKRAGVSREVADYRIKRLLKSGILRDYVAAVNLGELGYTKSVFYVELRGITAKREGEIVRYLCNYRFVSWIVISTGKWSIVFDIHSRDTAHLAAIISDVKRHIGKNLGEHTIVTLQDFKYFYHKYFHARDVRPTKKSRKTRIDDTDRVILKHLARDGRMSYVSLSKHVNLTPEAIGKRVKSLQQSGIILGFHIFPDLQKLGFEHYNVQVVMEQPNAMLEKQLMQYLEAHEMVSFYYRPISQWDFEFGVLARNPGELRAFIQGLRLRFQTLRIHDVALFYEEHKGNYIPEGVFEQ